MCTDKRKRRLAAAWHGECRCTALPALLHLLFCRLILGSHNTAILLSCLSHTGDQWRMTQAILPAATVLKLATMGHQAWQPAPTQLVWLPVLPAWRGAMGRMILYVGVHSFESAKNHATNKAAANFFFQNARGR